MQLKDRANRARWSKDQKAIARQNTVVAFERERLERITSLRVMLAHCAINSQAEEMFGAKMRVELTRLENKEG